MICPIEFAEGLGFNSLPISMVVALLITAIALAAVKEWFCNSNNNGDTHNNENWQEGTEMKKNERSNEGGNTAKALKTAISTALKVTYDTTVGMGAGALLQAPQVNAW